VTSDSWLKLTINFASAHPSPNEQKALCQKLGIYFENYTPKCRDRFHPRTVVQEALNCAGLVDRFRFSGSSAQLLWALHGLQESLDAIEPSCFCRLTKADGPGHLSLWPALCCLDGAMWHVLSMTSDVLKSPWNWAGSAKSNVALGFRLIGSDAEATIWLTLDDNPTLSCCWRAWHGW